MRIPIMLTAVIALPLIAMAQVHDPNLGRNLAASCAGCHGITGQARNGMPPLAGQSREALLRTLRDFKEGRRPATVMHQLAKGYTDGQLELVAAYYAAQKSGAP